MQEGIKTIKGIRRKEKMVKEDLDNAPKYAIWVKKDGKWLIWGGKNSTDVDRDAYLDKGYEDVKVVKNGTDLSMLKEDLEREFTIFFNREGFEYGSYGAVRVKAQNEDEAESKFYAKKKDDKVTISSIRPTENEDIRKGIRLMEEYENKIRPVKDEAEEEVNPAYAQALRDRKKFNQTREKKINIDLDNALNKKFNLDNMKKFTLDESLFTEEKESNIIRFVKGEFTKNELKQLRSDIALNSIYTSDYENRFGIDPAFVQDFFDGYVDFMSEDDSEDTLDNLESWYYTVDFSDYADDPSKLEADYNVD